MISLLGRMNKQRKGLMAQGSVAMPAEMTTDYEGKYFSILEQGRRGNRSTAHKYAKQDGKVQP